jgi:beta-lactamase class A
LQDLALMMITISDNTATDIIIDKVKLSRVNQMLETYSLKQLQTRVRKY